MASATALQKVADASSPRLPPPEAANVSGTLATLHVAGPVKVGDLRYAQSWQDVYASYHARSVVCVRMHLRWRTGELDQEFPANPNFL